MLDRRAASLLATTMAASWVSACGGGPDIDKVKADFENPTGQTANQQAVMAAGNQRETSSPILSLTGGGGLPGASLSASSRPRGLSMIAPRRVFERPMMDALETYRRNLGKETDSISLPLGTGENDCDEKAEEAFQEAFSEVVSPMSALTGGGGSGSASYSQDLSECSGGELTGTQEVEIELEVSENRVSLKIEMKLEDVCSTDSDRTCATGDFLWEAEATGTAGGAGSFQFVAAWDVDATWFEAGVERAGNLRGGIRLGFEGDDDSGVSSGEIEYLFYVTTEDGEEWSFVFALSGDSSGQATLEVRGSDGSVRCVFSGDGSGSCTGTGTRGSVSYSWSAADWEAVESEDFWYGD